MAERKKKCKPYKGIKLDPKTVRIVNARLPKVSAKYRINAFLNPNINI